MLVIGEKRLHDWGETAYLDRYVSAVLDADAVLLASCAERPVKRAGDDADPNAVAKKKYRRAWWRQHLATNDLVGCHGLQHDVLAILHEHQAAHRRLDHAPITIHESAHRRSSNQDHYVGMKGHQLYAHL